MNNGHICTRESLMHDAIELTGYCPVCCNDNQQIMAGWTEYQCAGCGYYFSSDSANEIVKNRRALLGLSRAEMAQKMRLSRKTIANYENHWPSRKYWDKTMALIAGNKTTSQRVRHESR